MNPIYLDNLSTTRPDPRVVDKLLPYLRESYANASSVAHDFGRGAARAVEEARAATMGLLGARQEDDIVFTSGATEANNLAILGLFDALTAPAHFIVSAVEHPSVLSSARFLRDHGTEVTVLPVDSSGRVDPMALSRALRPDTALVSIMAANNIVGTIQPIRELAALAHGRGAFFHCDAAQAAGKIPIDVSALGVDLLTASGHKVHGPKGVGILLVGGHVRDRVVPRAFGGGQQGGLRPGTLNVPSIVGLGECFRIASAEGARDSARVECLRDRLEDLLGEISGARFVRPPSRLPHVTFVGFTDVEAGMLLAALPEIVFSRGSACSADRSKASEVLTAIDAPPSILEGGVRLALSKYTSLKEIERTSQLIRERVEMIRSSGVRPGGLR